ncbi:FtsQ-type POTRA domain-containing protein [Mycoplasma sp. P36-A1]|uniref:FtsQ-type POTRA domain-containing protein n=1 Tax=Mycoplasma sp. P36-A1 TaxID=3252900 RepID=UPI003C2FCCF2
MEKNSLYDIDCLNEKIELEKKRRKERKARNMLLSAIAAVLVIIYLISPISRINSIIISGNERYDNAQIKEIANLEINQFTFTRPAVLISRALESSNLFKDVEVTKTLLGSVEIKVSENRLLFYDTENNKTVFYDQSGNKLTFEDSVTARYKGVVPELSENKKIDDDIKKKLINTTSQLADSVLNEISQIQYTPTNYDKEFFTFIMTGKKEIYIETSLDNIVKVGSRYHSFSINTSYKCSVIQYLDSENKAIVRKCDN